MATSRETPHLTINLKTLRSETVRPLTVPRNITIDDLFVEVARVIEVPEQTLRLIFGGQALKKGTRLSDYKIEDGFTVQVVPMRPRRSSEPEVPPPPLPSAEAAHPTPIVTFQFVDGTNPGAASGLADDGELWRLSCDAQIRCAEFQLKLSALQNNYLSGREQDTWGSLRDVLRACQQWQMHVGTIARRFAERLAVIPGGNADRTRPADRPGSATFDFFGGEFDGNLNQFFQQVQSQVQQAFGIGESRPPPSARPTPPPPPA